MAIKITLKAESMGKVQIQKILINDEIAVTSYSDGSVKRVYEMMVKNKKDVSLKDDLLIERFKNLKAEQIVKLKIDDIENFKKSTGNIIKLSYTKEII